MCDNLILNSRWIAKLAVLSKERIDGHISLTTMTQWQGHFPHSISMYSAGSEGSFRPKRLGMRHWECESPLWINNSRFDYWHAHLIFSQAVYFYSHFVTCSQKVSTTTTTSWPLVVLALKNQKLPLLLFIYQRISSTRRIQQQSIRCLLYTSPSPRD